MSAQKSAPMPLVQLEKSGFPGSVPAEAREGPRDQRRLLFKLSLVRQPIPEALL